MSEPTNVDRMQAYCEGKMFGPAVYAVLLACAMNLDRIEDTQADL